MLTNEINLNTRQSGTLKFNNKTIGLIIEDYDLMGLTNSITTVLTIIKGSIDAEKEEYRLEYSPFELVAIKRLEAFLELVDEYNKNKLDKVEKDVAVETY